MARDRGPSFEARVASAGLSPQQREAGRATLLLAELVAELLDAVREQNDQVAEHTERLAEQNALLTEIRDRQPAPVSITNAGGAGEGAEGGADVRLREPAVPPPDPDEDPAGRGGAVAEPATSKPTARRQTAKTTAGTAPAKATKATRRSTGRG